MKAMNGSVITELGLPASLQHQFSLYSACAVNDFRLPFRMVKQDDVVNVQLFFERTEGLGFACRYFDLSLRKKLELSDDTINGIDVSSLYGRMRDIDWVNALGNEPGNQTNTIITELGALSTDAAGKLWADRLKLLFWADTPMEIFVPNLSHQKNQYEISQRFYLFEGEEFITVHEACRFLSIKWREKQVMLEKKQKVNEGDDLPGSRSGSERVKGQKLLVKKRVKYGHKLKV